MKTICIDFDGVIHPNMKYLGTSKIIEPPLEGVKDFLIELSKQFKIIIHSARCEDSDGKEAIEKYLKKYNIEYKVSENKPHAYIYLDDREINFNGDFEKAMKDIIEFRQWQEDKKRKIKRLKKLNNRRIPIIN